MTDEDQYKSDYLWAGRPLRNLTDSEVSEAIQQRQEALNTANTEMGRQLCQIALDKLLREREGRSSRTMWRG